MITEGKYTSWFKTPVGEGMGVIELGPNGQLSGGDATFAYSGTCGVTGERVRAVLNAKRVVDGPPGVFGLDEIDIVATGYSTDGITALCTGFAKQSPGIKLEVTLVRMDEEPV